MASMERIRLRWHLPSETEFVVDKRHADELRRKRDVFRSVTGTRKSVFITLVTTFGVADNKHRRGVVDVVIGMDALFAPVVT
jgi:uncharacterized protein